MRAFLRYLRRWINVAFWHSWSIYERLSGFAVVVLFVVGRFQRVPEAASVMVTEIAIGIFVLLFTARMVFAPYWIAKEDADRIDRQQKEIDSLRDKLKPRLAITRVVDETEPAQAKYWPTQPANRTVKIEVKNTGADILHDCFVTLEHFTSDKAHIHKPEKAGLGGRFTLRAGEPIYIPVAALDERNAESEIELQFSPIIRNPIPRDDTYYFDIFAYSEASPDSRRFKLYVDKDGRLTMEECPQ